MLPFFYNYQATVILSLGLRIRWPNFSELMKINIMIFLTCVVYFSGKFMFDQKGFSIYNESGSKNVLKLPWLKHLLGVRACVKHGSIFKVPLRFWFIFILSQPHGHFSRKKTINLKYNNCGFTLQSLGH